MTAWQKLSQSEQKIGYKYITTKTFELPDGELAEFTTIGRIGNSSAAIIALTPDNQVVIARQYRPGPEKIMYELPGGGVEPGEDPAAAAVRELLEETGYASDQPILALGSTCRDAYTNETSYYYMALGCTKRGEQQLDDHEIVDVELLSVTQVIGYAQTGYMSDSPAILMAIKQLQEIVHG